MDKPNWPRYSLFAAGELLLVVAGIFIALQVDNWNEDRIQRDQIKEYVIALKSDLQRDTAMVSSISKQMRFTLNRIDTLSDFARRGALGRLSNLDLYFLTESAGYAPYQWNRSAMEQLKSSGALSKIRNTELVNKITAYDSFTRHLDGDYANDRDLMLDAMNFSDEVIDSNYVFDDDAILVWRQIYEEPYSFPPVKLYELHKNTELNLLTSDETRLRILVNKYSKLGGLKARTDRELPELLESANNLVGLIEAEYQD